jgi:hypothetical protein
MHDLSREKASNKLQYEKDIMIQVTKFAANLSPVNQTFLTEANKAITSQSKISFDELELLSQFNYTDTVLNPLPLFIGARVKDALHDCTNRVIHLTLKMLRGLIMEDVGAASEFYQIDPEYLKHLVEYDIESQVLCRSDIAFNESEMKILELNVGSNLGGWESSIYDQVYRSVPFLDCFLSEIPEVSVADAIEQLVTSLSIAMDGVFKDISEERKIAFFIPQAMLQSPVLQFANARCTAVVEKLNRNISFVYFCEDSQISFDEQKLLVSGERIHSLMLMGETSPISQDSPYRKDILNAFFTRNLILPDCPIHEVLNDKRNLALLHERSKSHFSEEEQKDIEKYIPWSVLSNHKACVFKGKEWDLQELLLSSQDQFVLKLNMSHGGKDVYIGRSMTQDNWQSIVKDAVQSMNFVVQEFCVPGYIHGLLADSLATFQSVWGVFSFGGLYAGVFVRMMPRDEFDSPRVINTANGAQETIVYEV